MGVGTLNATDVEVIKSKLSLIVDQLDSLSNPINDSLVQLGMRLWLNSEILPLWEQMEENDHTLILEAVNKSQVDLSLALSCLQDQLWMQSIMAHLLRPGYRSHIPMEV